MKTGCDFIVQAPEVFGCKTNHNPTRPNSNLFTSGFKGVSFRILQNNSDSLLDIALNTKICARLQHYFLVYRSVPNNFLEGCRAELFIYQNGSIGEGVGLD